MKTAGTSLEQATLPKGSQQAIQCDLVLLHWNRAELLKSCLEKLLEHTKIPFRLILVDNGSSEPETHQLLDQIQPTQWMTPHIIRRQKNEGFSPGVNAGLAEVKAPWVCVLNNDIEVTEGWLEELLSVAAAHPEVGCWNPTSNEFGIAPGAGESLESFSKNLRETQAGSWIENWSCVGFCFFFSKQLLDHIGPLDERYRFMYFEDADFSMRVREAGLACGVAQGSYVRHIGGETNKDRPELPKQFLINEERFYTQWKRPNPQRIAWVLPPEGPQPSGTREQIRTLANDDHLTWVYCTGENRSNVAHHLQVYPIELSKYGFGLWAIFKLLTRKKKYDRILFAAPHPLVGWFQRLTFIHQAQVEILECP